LQRTCIILAELKRTQLNELHETRTWNKALLHKHEKNAIIARSHYKLKANTATSSYAPKPINPRLSRPSLIPKEPEFNLKYLRFAF
jgi:hypothetical protein